MKILETWHTFSKAKLNHYTTLNHYTDTDDSVEFLSPPVVSNENVYYQWSGFAAEKIPKSSDEDYEEEKDEILEVFIGMRTWVIGARWKSAEAEEEEEEEEEEETLKGSLPPAMR